MPDNSAWKSDTEPFRREDVTGFENVVKAFLSDTGANAENVKKQHDLAFTEKSQREVFIKYLFSALTDSDWLSTESHFEQDTFEMRIGTPLPIDEMLSKLETEFSMKIKGRGNQ